MIVCCDLMFAEDLCNERPEVEDMGVVNEDSAFVPTTHDLGLVILHCPL
jgi:hypothetical protein